jgi:ssDNA-binding Zn-finger/Zn-ribbon topoisomerase 1
MPNEYPKYTASVSGLGKVSISLRTDNREELDAFLEEHRQTNGDTRKKKRYMHEGDNCLGCEEGSMVHRESKKDGEEPFSFLGCSTFPRCEFTAYQSKYPKKDP